MGSMNAHLLQYFNQQVVQDFVFLMQSESLSLQRHYSVTEHHLSPWACLSSSKLSTTGFLLSFCQQATVWNCPSIFISRLHHNGSAISHQPSAFCSPSAPSIIRCASVQIEIMLSVKCQDAQSRRWPMGAKPQSRDLWICGIVSVFFFFCLFWSTNDPPNKGLTLYFSRRDAVMPKQVAQIGSHTQAFIHTGLCFFTQQVCNRLNRSQLKDPWSRA